MLGPKLQLQTTLARFAHASCSSYCRVRGGKKSEIWFRVSTSVAFEALWFRNEVTYTPRPEKRCHFIFCHNFVKP